MPDKIVNWNFALVALIVVLFIAYGSLYPFDFHAAPSGALRALIAGRGRPLQHGDALANVLLYLPLGCFAFLAIGREAGLAARAALAVLLGLALSVGIELLQYYDAGRDSEMTDVYTNVTGTALGVAVAHGLGDHWRRLSRRGAADPAALLLLAAWAGYNLFPFVPVIDLHKYWSALKPLFHPDLTWYSLFTHASAWLAAAALIDDVSAGRKAPLRFAAFAAILLGSKIVVLGGQVTAAQIGGAAIAFAALSALRSRPPVWPLAALAVLGCAVLAERLEPFHFVAQGRQFGWIPFLSFMHGSIQVDSLSFLEKGFLYGSLIWLLQKAGLPALAATLGVAALLFATSWAEIYLPVRSAEITDMVMALIIGGVMALVRAAAARAAEDDAVRAEPELSRPSPGARGSAG